MESHPIIFGEVLFDCFEDGSRVLGGAPFNVAWHLQALGAAPLFISRVGDDSLGRRIRDTMQQWGLSSAALQLDSAHPTGSVEVTIQDGEPHFEIVAERAYDFIQANALPPLEATLIYHGSLALRQPHSASALASLKQSHPAPIFLDVNLRPPWWNAESINQMLDDATWAKLNDDEVNTLLPGSKNLQNKAEHLLQCHQLELIIVTRGSQGAFALNSQQHHAEIVPTSDTRVVDTVGAGDAFASICILGLLRDWDLASMLSRAQVFASLIVGMRGATVRDTALYQRLKQQWGL
ncbi:carbohydrate kinase family protein [Candidatus Endoriftia persephonae]|jgi:fructokinase|uniref:PfkB domain protein n=2 Tax=Gammaproteobacteria TaxID=1236 RepID=G2FJ76_9GAMM|nr:carbohydrate kinase [Candidatus Endoriftia persephone]EGW53169.1 PfkB domain protein [endosymbiont of Tevnia jerichonana (vent Tica)]USF89096.1 carbohydrate kinase [Candidatus Endoriftia persephone]